MKIAMLLTELHRHEHDLVRELLELSDRHRAIHEIHHVARDLARWSAEHVEVLAEVGPDHGAELDARAPTDATSRDSASSSMELLSDLRSAYMNAAGISVQWVMLGQAADALHLDDLQSAVSRCHPGTLRQMRWAATSLKQQSTQILVS